MTLMMSIDCPMKKIVSLLGIIALCAASFTACNKASENDIQEKGKHIIKVTPVLGETRTVLEEDGSTIAVKWTDSDIAVDPEGNSKFHVWENDAKGLTGATLNQDKTIATITCVFDENTSENLVYSSCFAKQLDASGNPVVLAFQNPSPSSFDPDADLLIGEDIPMSSQPDELLVNFTRPVALVKMTLKGLEVGESVRSVLVTSKSGKRTGAYNRSQGAFDFTAGEDAIVVCPTGVTVGSDGTAPVYFVSAPVENEILEVEVWTSIGGGEPTAERHYKKEFAKGISFPANKLTRFTANLTCCEEVEGGTEATTIFNETFDGCDGTGGRDNNFSGSIASNNYVDAEMATEVGWTMTNVKAASECIKIGSKTTGSAVTRAIDFKADVATLSFDAALWDNKDEKFVIVVNLIDGGEGASITPSEFTLEKSTWKTFTATITNASANAKIEFTEKETTTRFFLDNIVVTEDRTVDPNIVHLDVAANTDINGSQTEATVAIQSNKAWTVTSSDELLADTPIKINGTAQTTSFTVNFAAANTSVTEPKVATLHVVAGAGSYVEEKDITITQKPVTAYINIPTNEKTQTVEASATSATFTVSGCNFDWDVISVTVDGVANPNYTATKGANGVVTVSFPSNEADGATTLDKVIVVTVGNAEIKTNTCTITQQGETYVDPNKRYYVKVTGNQTDWTGNYLIVSGNKALPGQTIDGSTHTPITVSVAGDRIEATSNEIVNSVFISTGSASGKWYIHGVSGYYGGASKSISVDDEGIDNEISLEEGVLSIKSNGFYLRYNSQASAGPFRYYASLSTGSNIELFKFNGQSEDLFISQLTMSDVSCTNDGQSENSLTFSWTKVEGAIGYQVSEDGVTFGQTKTALTYTISDLEPGTTRSIWVKAIGDGTFYTTSSAKSAQGTTKEEGVDESYTYTFTSNSWAATPTNWTSGKAGNQLTSGRGVQVTTNTTGANATSPVSFTNVSSIEITYSTNASNGAGSIAVQVGSGTAKSQNVTNTGGTTDRTLTYTFNPNESGKVKFTVNCTTNSIYIKSITINAASNQ